MDVWGRDIVEVVADLIGRPDLDGRIRYVPKEDFVEDVVEELGAETDQSEKQRLYTDFVNTDWWKRVKVSLM